MIRLRSLRRPLLLLVTPVVLALALAPVPAPDGATAQSRSTVWLPVALTAGAPPRDPDRLLATGQAWGYRGNHGEPGDGNRDDGDLIRGRARDYDYTAVELPSDQRHNVVVDRQTGLMWVRDVRLLTGTGGVHGNVALDASMSWQTAIDRIDALAYAGHDDWRLPNLKELQTLIDYGRSDPALDTRAFPGRLEDQPSPYAWTSTTYPGDQKSAFYVNFLNGHTYPFGKGVPLWARPVRTLAVDDPVALLRTGQHEGYAGDEGDIAPGNGDDGDRQLGLVHRYYHADDGTIDTPEENIATDLSTDLVWVRDVRLLTGAGGVHGDAALDDPLDWQTAIDRINTLEYAGYDDWRLPNIVELESISQPGRSDSRLFDPAAFPNTPSVDGDGARSVWWSSTTAAFDRDDARPGRDAAWYLTNSGTTSFIDDDHSPAKSRPAFVRPVRDRTARARHPLHVEEVRASSEWAAITLASARPDLLREGKYIVPLDGLSDPPFRSAYQDVSVHPLHYEFLVAAFPGHFGGLTPTEYAALVSRRDTRGYFAGGLKSFHDADGQRVYGFDVYTDPTEPGELLTEAETEALYRQLSRTFRRRPLAYSPWRPEAVALARTWDETAFPIAYPVEAAAPDYEAYTTGQAYGFVRRLTLSELDEAASAGQLSHQEIVVLDAVPADLEGVTAGIVTGGRQGALSHLGVRTARRGTPNAYVRDSHDAFAPYEGQLVRLSVTRSGYFVETDVALEDAEAWWSAIRPPAVAIRAADADHAGLDDLATIGGDDQDSRATARFGGKAANLARLFTFLPVENQVPGFAIPFHYYLDFIADNSLTDERGGAPATRTYAAHIEALHDDAVFRGDPTTRTALLNDLRDVMRDDGEVPEPLVTALAARIDAVFGPGVMVRFRSSSNAEDGLEFNGAGLYDSTSVCAADSLDGDTSGPSHCDPNQRKERTIERGLKKVWASLWNARAWEEREYYGIDHTQAAMAVLVTPAFPDERANGVAFTGDPARPDTTDYLVSVQDGDVSVVHSGGVLPERNALEILGGSVTRVQRLQPSSLMPPGEWVMSEDELRALGELMALADERYPVDAGEHDRSDVLLDFEFKIRREDDGLVIKQVRPFLKRQPGPAGQPIAVRVHAPDPPPLCGAWREGLGLRRELDEQAVLQLGAIDLELPPDASEVTHDLFGDLTYGPDLLNVEAIGPGEARFEDEGGDGATRRLVLARRYADGAREIDVELTLSGLPAGEFDLRWLDEPYLTWRAAVTAVVRDVVSGAQTTRLRLAPCGYGELPRYRFDIAFEGDAAAVLTQRRERDDGVTGQAALVEAEVRLPEGEQSVADYGRLVYAADRHHWNEQFMVRFDPPLGEAHGLAFYRDVEGGGDPTYRAELLSVGLATLRTLTVTEVARTRVP